MEAILETSQNRSVGRPSKLTPHIIKKTKHYLKNYKEYGKNIPSVARLAQALDVTEKTIYNWINKEDETETKEQFLQLLDKINQQQKIELLENGLEGKYNSSITKLVLAKHGYHDKQEVTQTNTHIISDIEGSELARRLAFVLAKQVEGKTIDNNTGQVIEKD